MKDQNGPDSINKNRVVVGVDMGGTKIRTGLVRFDALVPDTVSEISTAAGGPRNEVASRLFQSIRDAVKRGAALSLDVAGIGIGSPGPLDLSEGRILEAPNLPSLHHYPLKHEVEKAFSLPVCVDNDGNCFVLGEVWYGGLRGSACVVGLTLGTGVGCGLVIQDRIYHGQTGTAAEIWKTPFRGRRVEETLSGRGIEVCYGKIAGKPVEGSVIHRRALEGEKAALEAWKTYGRNLGEILAGIINLLDPGVVVLGGSVSAGYPFFQTTMLGEMRKHIHPLPMRSVRVVPGHLGVDSGLLGAAALCYSNASGHHEASGSTG
jgi:glucokinase